MAREIKEENENYRDYSMKLRKFNVINNKLIPLFLTYSSLSKCEE